MADDVARTGQDEIGEDKAFERRWRRFQHVAWTVLSVFVLAGVAGVFGSGPLSEAHVTSDTGAVRIVYPRSARYATPATLKVILCPRVGTEAMVTVLVSGPPIRFSVPRRHWM